MNPVVPPHNPRYAASPFWRAVVHSSTVQRIFVWLFKRLFGLRVRNLELVPLPRTYILASNHGSHYDIFFALVAFCDIARRAGLTEHLPVATLWNGAFDIPIIGGVLKAVPCVGIERTPGKQEERVGALREMIAHLRAGRFVVVGCEGKRDDVLDEFAHGAAFLSLHTGIPVVPVSLRGVQGLYRKLAFPERFGGRVEVILHAPLDPATFEQAGGSRLEMAARFTDAIRSVVAADVDYSVKTPGGPARKPEQ